MTAPATQETQPLTEQLTAQQALDYIAAAYDIFYDEPVPGVSARNGMLFVDTDQSRIIANIGSDSKAATTGLWAVEAVTGRSSAGARSRTTRHGRKTETTFTAFAGSDTPGSEIEDPEAWFVSKTDEMKAVITEKLKYNYDTKAALEQRIRDISKHSKGRRLGNATLAAVDLGVVAGVINGETHPQGPTYGRDISALIGTVIAYRFGRAGLIRGKAAIRGKGAPTDAIHGTIFDSRKKQSGPIIPDGLGHK